MNELTKHIQDDTPWCTLFTDDTVLLDWTKEGVNTKVEIWRETLEQKDLKFVETKVKYIECNFSDSRSRNNREVKFEN